MPNKASNQLHELIKSLTSSEKRYFKLFANRHSSGQKNYLLLFDAIDAQATYDETALLKDLKRQGFVNHFSIAKNRLYHQILKGLESYHAAHSSLAEIDQYLHYAEILFKKSLYNQCERILSSAEKLAEKHQVFSALVRIKDWQKKLIERKNYEETSRKKLDKINLDEKSALESLRLLSDLWTVKSHVFSQLFKRGRARTPEEIRELLVQIESLQKRKKEAKGNYEAEFLINHTTSAVYFQIADYQACFQHLINNRDLIEKNPLFIQKDPGAYLSVLTNLIYVSAKINRFGVMEEALRKSRQLPTLLKNNLSEDLKFKIFSQTFSLELSICNLAGDISKSEFLMQEIPRGLEKWNPKLGEVRKASFYHGLSVMAFLQEDLKKALWWNNLLLNTISIDETEDQYCFAQIFHAVLQIEKENYDLIPTNLKSLRRNLKLRNRNYKFEEEFIELLSQVSKVNKKDHLEVAFLNFKKAIEQLEEDPYEKTAFEFFDFTAWAQSHLSEKSIVEIIRDRAPLKNIL